VKLTTVAIVAVDGFSPFHYSVPCILFGDTVSGKKRFEVTICAEKPGLLTSRDGFALNAAQDYSAIGQADIVVVPYWQHVLERPPQTLLDSLVQARDKGAQIVGLNLDALAASVAMSRRTLTRHFMKATGMSVVSWIAAERLRRSQLLLESSNLPIEAVAEQVGYLSAVTWRQQFKARFGVSPAEWRKTFRLRS